ncbi:MAG TPA: TVP38/TMEM64 family protein [Longimicrobium sp.]|jgi:uncharacterized membrane protein YdjX (TVP38/TMEM64 family)
MHHPDTLVDEDAERPGAPWKRGAVAAVIVAGLVAFFAFDGPEYLNFATLRSHRAEFLAYRDRHYVAVAVAAVLIYIVMAALSIPGGMILSLGIGFLYGRWMGTAMVVFAATIGATVAFLSARYLLADVARRRMGPRLQRISAGFERDGFSYLLFLHLVPAIPFVLVNLAPAFSALRTRTFVAGTALGIVPGTFVYVYLGESLGRIDTAGDLVSTPVLVALTLLGVLSILPVVVNKVRHSRNPAAP